MLDWLERPELRAGLHKSEQGRCRFVGCIVLKKVNVKMAVWDTPAHWGPRVLPTHPAHTVGKSAREHQSGLLRA
jgi:hypothetical protein